MSSKDSGPGGDQNYNPPKKRRNNYAKMSRIMLSISDGLLKIVDEAAEKDFTTRSDMIRTALLWYLRPQGRDLDQTNPDEIVKTLQRRRMNAALKSMIKDIGINS